MGDFRLEDLWAIIQGLLIVGGCLFSGMALIALWPKIEQVARSAWHRYVVFQWRGYLADTARVKRLRAEIMKSQVRRAGITSRDYVEMPNDTAGTKTIPPVPDTVDTKWLAEHLTEEQRLEVMALAKTPKGKWVYSGKKLFTVFGGNYNEFVATMRRLRDGDDDDMPEEPPATTPIAMRRTHAKFHGQS